jgi:hypothetical protein
MLITILEEFVYDLSFIKPIRITCMKPIAGNYCISMLTKKLDELLNQRRSIQWFRFNLLSGSDFNLMYAPQRGQRAINGEAVGLRFQSPYLPPLP